MCDPYPIGSLHGSDHKLSVRCIMRSKEDNQFKLAKLEKQNTSEDLMDQLMKEFQDLPDAAAKASDEDLSSHRWRHSKEAKRNFSNLRVCVAYFAMPRPRTPELSKRSKCDGSHMVVPTIGEYQFEIKDSVTERLRTEHGCNIARYKDSFVNMIDEMHRQIAREQHDFEATKIGHHMLVNGMV